MDIVPARSRAAFFPIRAAFPADAPGRHPPSRFQRPAAPERNALNRKQRENRYCKQRDF
jgi:hypothetical protein